jgi:hypothetical protein
VEEITFLTLSNHHSHKSVKYVVNGDCWECVSHRLNEGGYATVRYNGEQWYIHRLSYHLHKGKVPEGMVVMHTCDNPKCINPDHLGLGSQLDNIVDRNVKGRNQKGNSHWNSTLTESQVREIKVSLRGYKRGMIKALAEQFEVNKATILDIKAERTWKSVQI